MTMNMVDTLDLLSPIGRFMFVSQILVMLQMFEFCHVFALLDCESSPELSFYLFHFILSPANWYLLSDVSRMIAVHVDLHYSSLRRGMYVQNWDALALINKVLLVVWYSHCISMSRLVNPTCEQCSEMIIHLVWSQSHLGRDVVVNPTT